MFDLDFNFSFFAFEAAFFICMLGHCKPLGVGRNEEVANFCLTFLHSYILINIIFIIPIAGLHSGYLHILVASHYLKTLYCFQFSYFIKIILFLIVIICSIILYYLTDVYLPNSILLCQCHVEYHQFLLSSLQCKSTNYISYPCMYECGQWCSTVVRSRTLPVYCKYLLCQ